MPKLFDGGNRGLPPVEGDSRCLSLLKATADADAIGGDSRWRSQLKATADAEAFRRRQPVLKPLEGGSRVLQSFESDS